MKRLVILSIFLVLGCTSNTPSSENDPDSKKDTTSTPIPLSMNCEEPAPWPDSSTVVTVGTGTPVSCTEEALRKAVTTGGSVRFDCGGSALTIQVRSEIKAGPKTIVDGSTQNITLDGGGNNRIFVAPNNNILSVRNLRFINGSTHGDEADGIGGAVAGLWRSAVEVRNCTFENNAAERGGGAVSVWTGSSLVIVSSRFTKNRSFYGGAVYSLLSSLHIANSEFVDNETLEEGYGDGGAIGTDGASEDPDDEIGGSIEICGSRISGSKGHGSGGGAYLWVYPPDQVLIDRTTVEGNTIGGGGLGGAMRISNGTIEIRLSSFISNISDNHGGALYLDCEPTCNVVNSTFAHNQAKMYGGAISGVKNAFFNNVTFAYNTAGGHGGALFGDDFTVHNSLFVNNSSGNPWNQAHNCGAKGSGSHVMQWLSTTNNGGYDSCVDSILAVNPLLDSIPGDHGGPTPTLLLAAESPALQVGNDCESTDQRGNPRDTSSCDLGAVELP